MGTLWYPKLRAALGCLTDTEERLAAPARAGGPLRRVMAALALRWADREGWERLGYARLADHARERLGLSARSIQELARVGRKLDDMPELEASLVCERARGRQRASDSRSPLRATWRYRSGDGLLHAR